MDAAPTLAERLVPYRNRSAAGEALAGHLLRYAGRDDVVVLALPRGGVPVAAGVAHALNTPLDVVVVRKLGLPGHEEYAIGAIAGGGVRVLNTAAARVSRKDLQAVIEREEAELKRRERLYRGPRPALPLQGRVAIVVDDGLATGSTMRAALAALRLQGPARLVAAVPVGPASACVLLSGEADEVVCPATPEPFHAVGQWYRDFTQTGDDEVRRLLDEAARSYEALAH